MARTKLARLGANKAIPLLPRQAFERVIW